MRHVKYWFVLCIWVKVGIYCPLSYGFTGNKLYGIFNDLHNFMVSLNYFIMQVNLRGIGFHASGCKISMMACCGLFSCSTWCFRVEQLNIRRWKVNFKDTMLPATRDRFWTNRLQLKSQTSEKKPTCACTVSNTPGNCVYEREGLKRQSSSVPI